MLLKVCSTILGLIILFTQSTVAFADQNLQVTATVPANSTDATVEISALPVSSVILYEGDEVLYTLRYKVNASGSYPFTLQASWTKGLIENTSTLVDAMDYVISSAQISDDGTVPVVDLENRTITWDISSLSDSVTYHTVTFRLKVVSNLTTDQRLTVNTRVDGTINTAHVIPAEVQHTIQGPTQPSPTPTAAPTTAPSPTATPTITPTPVPGTTSSPAATSTPTTVPPTPTAAPSPTQSDVLKFTSMRITGLTDTSAQIIFSTSMESKYSISYGTDKKKLDSSITDGDFLNNHTINLSELLPNQKYFFVIKAQDRRGRTITSDIMTFTTAGLNESLIIDPSTTTIYSDKVPLTSEDVTTVVVPHSRYIKVKVKFAHPEILMYMRAEFRKADVLGISTDSNNYSSKSNFVESLPGVLSSEIQVPDVLDKYQLVFFIKTTNGTLLNKAAPFIFYVTDSIRVMNLGSKYPIEGATVKISKYQPGSSTYTPLDQALTFRSISDYNGNVQITLPIGVYKIETSSTGYLPNETTVELGTKDLQYPTIALERSSTITSILASIKRSVSECVNTVVNNISLSSLSWYALNGLLVFIALAQLVALFIYLRTKKAIYFLSFKKWLAQIIYISFVSLLWTVEFFLLILYTFTLGIIFSYPLIIILGVNTYIAINILRTFWIEYKNEEKHELT